MLVECGCCAQTTNPCLTLPNDPSYVSTYVVNVVPIVFAVLVLQEERQQRLQFMEDARRTSSGLFMF